MKDISDYFNSPSKSTKSIEALEKTKPFVETSELNTNNKNDIQTNHNGLTVSKGEYKSSKKKLKRKLTDPEVKGVTELLTNNLSLVSPTSISKCVKSPSTPKNEEKFSKSPTINVEKMFSSEKEAENKSSQPPKNIENNENETKNTFDGEKIEVVEGAIIIDVQQKQTPNSKVNAFQFMMSSRNNIIGQNSNGKSIKDEDISISDKKPKLKTRKDLFKDWADQKGGLKRKREEEEIEKCIKFKMEKRAKKLKNLLRIQKEEKKCGNHKKVPLKSKKIVRKISSSESESSNDIALTESTKLEEGSSPLININEVIEENAQDVILSPKNMKENAKHNLLNFLGVVNMKEKDHKIEVFDDTTEEKPKELIKIKMFTPESAKKRTSLVSLKKNHSKSLIDESSQESIKLKKHKKKKKNSKPSSSSQLNDSIEDFCSSETQGQKTEIAQKNKDKPILNEDVLVVEESTQDSDIINVKKKKATSQCIIYDSDSSKDETKIKTTSEPQGRVLRPKKNLNYSDLYNDETSKKQKGSAKKSTAKKNKDECVENVYISSDSDSDLQETSKKKTKAPPKVAPVFLKATPKPKLDPEKVEARKKFLMSGVPESLKASFEKQKSLEEQECDTFPTISHVQQKCESILWNLPKPDLKYTEDIPFQIKKESLVSNNLIVKKPAYNVQLSPERKQLSNIKSLLENIKTENPDYPVYKVFRQIYEKSGKNFDLQNQPIAELPRKRSKKVSKKSVEVAEIAKTETMLKHNEVWSEKYKPQCSDDILGNHNGIKALKNWLGTWLNYSEEINSSRKRKRANSNSESEFESTDCDSRDSIRLPGNTMILEGPCGSGKTSAVYAIANELGFNVLELNASSKRTGKKLLQELQEATQSHQVRKSQHTSLTNFMSYKDTPTGKSGAKLKKSDLEDECQNKAKKKMCILLVEDIDLVFEQDEGFLTSLSQLITTSKRPIILTTTDNSPGHIQKFLAQYECISFMPLSHQCLSVWLQVLCLVEGMLVDRDDLGNLLEYNKGDIRKTLLELQFWCQSGGQLEKTRDFPLKTQYGGACDMKALDEDLKIPLKEDCTSENKFVHKFCLGSFEIFRENEEYNIPREVDLGKLWWNMPNILDISSCSTERLNRPKGNIENNLEEAKGEMSEKDQQKLNSVMRLYDAVTLTDAIFNSVSYGSSNEPVVKNWMTDVKDSLELIERNDDKMIHLGLMHTVTHSLLNGCIESYKNIDHGKCKLNMAMPDATERRWRAKQHICEDFLKEPITLSNALDRSSIALDYLPVLRHIARSEDKRAAANTKRGNRFRHYMKNLNMNFKESACKLACGVLSFNHD